VVAAHVGDGEGLGAGVIAIAVAVQYGVHCTCAIARTGCDTRKRVGLQWEIDVVDAVGRNKIWVRSEVRKSRDGGRPRR
jgi:hypothetical protein